MTVVFLGTGDFGAPSLRALAGRHCVVAVVTQPDRPAGRGNRLRASPIKVLAGELALPVLQPARLRHPDAIAELADQRADIFVVVAYGQILSRAVLDLPRHGCLNVHASLLPRHRGASPVHAAILAGDDRTGVTIMKMDEGLDTGAILVQSETQIGESETAGELHDRLACLAPGTLLETLDHIESIRPRPQENALAMYAPKLSRDDGRIDWSRTSVEVVRHIRGMTPWPGALALLPHAGGHLAAKILRASEAPGVSDRPGTVQNSPGLVIAAGEGGVRILELQSAGGRALSAEEFLRGRKLEPGMVCGAIPSGEAGN